MPDRKTKKTQAKRAPKAGKSSTTTGSYLLSLELENVRCFAERQTLDLSDGHGRPARWTILLGENGTGKTTILQMLAFASVSEPDFDFGQPQYRAMSMAFSSMADGLVREGRELAADYLVAQGIRFVDNGSDPCRIPLRAGRQLGSFFLKVLETQCTPILLPTCFAYSVVRNPGSQISLQGHDLLDSADGLFLKASSIGDSEGWLLRLDYASSKDPRAGASQRQRLDLVKDVLIRILPDVSEIRFDASSGFFPTPNVQFKTPYGWVPLRQLGHGYRTMIAWVVDLAARMIERYPDSRNPLAEPAVVLVDEIDLHLHPKWQREVVGYLTERFPNIQFIVTAHSPLIVQSAADANLALLKRVGDHVVIENHPETIRGWRIDQVLTSDLFGLPTARPLDEEKLLLRRDQLLAKSRLTAADRKELGDIQERIALPTGESFEQARTMELIKDSIEYLKKRQGLEP